MEKFNVDFKEGKAVASYDGDADGEKSLKLELDLKEVYGELLAKGEAKIDVKSMSLKLDGSKVVATIDTDKDGEALMVAELDIVEAMSEAM